MGRTSQVIQKQVSRVFSVWLVGAFLLYGLCAFLLDRQTCCPAKTHAMAGSVQAVSQGQKPDPGQPPIKPCCLKALFFQPQSASILAEADPSVDLEMTGGGSSFSTVAMAALLEAFRLQSEERNREILAQAWYVDESDRYLTLRVLLN
jgi:hypothetical protein